MFAYWKGRIAPGKVMRQAVTTMDLTATIAQVTLTLTLTLTTTLA